MLHTRIQELCVCAHFCLFIFCYKITVLENAYDLLYTTHSLFNSLFTQIWSGWPRCQSSGLSPMWLGYDSRCRQVRKYVVIRSGRFLPTKRQQKTPRPSLNTSINLDHQQFCELFRVHVLETLIGLFLPQWFKTMQVNQGLQLRKQKHFLASLASRNSLSVWLLNLSDGLDFLASPL